MAGIKDMMHTEYLIQLILLQAMIIIANHNFFGNDFVLSYKYLINLFKKLYL